MLSFALALAIPLLGGCLAGTSVDEANRNPDDGFGGGAGGGDMNPDPGEPSGQCQVAEDCVLAASTCCECPSFAAPVGEGYDAGCDAVDCKEPSGLCPAVEATCDSGECVMICSPVEVNRTCAFGFERDAGGCLQNSCAATPPSGGECQVDNDCVQIPADCCGCDGGGADQAVPNDEAESILDGLACPDNPSCPDIDVCDVSQVPRCIAGLCALADEPMNPNLEEPSIQMCGTPELGMCPEGFRCLLNGDSAKKASDLGVGSCSPE